MYLWVINTKISCRHWISIIPIFINDWVGALFLLVLLMDVVSVPNVIYIAPHIHPLVPDEPSGRNMHERNLLERV